MKGIGVFVYRSVLVGCILGCISLAYLLSVNNTTQLEVKVLPVVRLTPKGRLIPNADTLPVQADISNAPINAKIKKPIVIKF